MIQATLGFKQSRYLGGPLWTNPEGRQVTPPTRLPSLSHAQNTRTDKRCHSIMFKDSWLSCGGELRHGVAARSSLCQVCGQQLHARCSETPPRQTAVPPLRGHAHGIMPRLADSRLWVRGPENGRACSAASAPSHASCDFLQAALEHHHARPRSCPYAGTFAVSRLAGSRL